MKIDKKSGFAVCDYCDRTMIISKTCGFDKIILSGRVYKRDSSHFDFNKRCHDCGIINKKGNYHHLGCDVERCPSCKGQLISCECWYEKQND